MTPPNSPESRNTARPAEGAGHTAERVLDVAQEMIQKRGYNGFSYRDIAAALGIKSASIHYHFPCKADLGKALVDRYRQNFLRELAQIDTAQTTAPKRLKAFVELFRRTLTDDRTCLCGMLAAEHGSLPEEVKAEVQAFFAGCQAWLADLLKRGRTAGEIDFLGAPLAMADHVLGLMEGAMILARSLEDLSRFDRAVATLLRSLQPVSPPPRSRS